MIGRKRGQVFDNQLFIRKQIYHFFFKKDTPSKIGILYFSFQSVFFHFRNESKKVERRLTIQ